MYNGKMVMVIAATVFAFILPLGVLAWWKIRTHVGIWTFIAGAVCFLVFAMGLEQILHTLCLASDNAVSRAINSNALLYGLYGAFAAGIFEETGRLFGFKVLLRKRREPDNSIAYGIGHGGVEVLIVFGVTYLIYLLALCGVSFGDEATDKTILQTINQIPPVAPVIAFVERIFAMMIHIGLSVIVFNAAWNHKAKWFFLAILIHAAVDFPAALYQKGIITSLLFVEFWAALLGVLLLINAIKLYKELKLSYGVEQSEIIETEQQNDQ